jgi:hypothetical protein
MIRIPKSALFGRFGAWFTKFGEIQIGFVANSNASDVFLDVCEEVFLFFSRFLAAVELREVSSEVANLVLGVVSPLFPRFCEALCTKFPHLIREQEERVSDLLLSIPLISQARKCGFSRICFFKKKRCFSIKVWQMQTLFVRCCRKTRRMLLRLLLCFAFSARFVKTSKMLAKFLRFCFLLQCQSIKWFGEEKGENNLLFVWAMF